MTHPFIAEVLAAADAIEIRAFKASPGPWTIQRGYSKKHGGLVQSTFTKPSRHEGAVSDIRSVRIQDIPDYEWICLMSPAVAEPLVALLRQTARQMRFEEGGASDQAGFEAFAKSKYNALLDLVRVINDGKDEGTE
jgi:hypothetical protein